VIILKCVLVKDLCWMVRVVPLYVIFCHDALSPSVFVNLRMSTVLTKDLISSEPSALSLLTMVDGIFQIRFTLLLISCTLVVLFYVFSTKAAFLKLFSSGDHFY
jgi:hypothetical protein